MSKKEKLLAAAQKNLLKGQVAKAIKDYEKVVEADPADVRNRQKLGELYSRIGMVDAAFATYDSVARHYSQNGFYLKAIAVYKQMQKLDPSQPSVYYRLAELNEKQGLIGNALAEYRQLVQLLRDQGAVDEAVIAIEKMQRLDPDNLKLRMDLVEIHAQNLNVDRAAQAFGQTLEHLQEKKDLTCSARLRQALESFCPGNVELKIGLGRLLIRGGDPESGVALLKEILAEQPQQPNARLLLAEGCHLTGAFGQEQDIYGRFLELEPDNLDLREKYVGACLACGNGLTAIKALEGWTETFFEAGNLSVLKDFFEQLNALFPENEGILQTLHRVYEKTGEGGKLFDLYSSGEGQERLGFEGESDVIAGMGEGDESGAYGDLPIEEPADERLDDPKIPAAGVSPSVSVVEDLAGYANFELEIELEMTGSEVSEVSHAFDFDNLELDDTASGPVVGESDFFEGLGDLDLDLGCPVDAASEQKEAEPHQEVLPDSGKKINAGQIRDREKSRLDGSMTEFKKGLEDQIGAEDTETHFNLGIAYKEMGLLDDAVEQFDKALKDPERRIDCLTLKGVCLLEKGEFDLAAKTFKTGLALMDLNEEERVSLYYELGLLYLAWGQPLEALDSFQCVADVHPLFREVEVNIRALRKELGLDDNGVESSGNGSGKNRVSYI